MLGDIHWVLQVSKPVAVVQEFVRVCNAIAEGSFDDSTRSVDFNRLDATQIKATGFFGDRHSVWSALVDVGVLLITPPE